MKKILMTLFVFVVSFSSILAQDTMYVHEQNGKITAFPVNKIDSVIFYRSNAMGETITDIDGNVYRIVTIGSQTWMGENLKTTRYYDGTPIPLITDATEWSELETPGYCWYNNNESENKGLYGALYNWYAAAHPKICPEGWHVPSDEEWTVLTDYLGGESTAGGKLKEAGTEHWREPNTGATNETGFTALPAGIRYGTNGDYKSQGEEGRWWTSTDHETFGSGWFRTMKYGSRNVGRHHLLKIHGFCIRCIKD